MFKRHYICMYSSCLLPFICHQAVFNAFLHTQIQTMKRKSVWIYLLNAYIDIDTAIYRKLVTSTHSHNTNNFNALISDFSSCFSLSSLFQYFFCWFFSLCLCSRIPKGKEFLFNCGICKPKWLCVVICTIHSSPLVCAWCSGNKQ